MVFLAENQGVVGQRGIKDLGNQGVVWAPLPFDVS